MIHTKVERPSFMTPQQRDALSLEERVARYVRPAVTPGVFTVALDRFDDDRGSMWARVKMRELNAVVGRDLQVEEWMHSVSRSNVIRGLHTDPWDKLAYISHGEGRFVVVNLVQDSPSFGEAEVFDSLPDNRFALFIPRGFPNGLSNLGTDQMDYILMYTGSWDGSSATGSRAINPLDQDLAIDWGVRGKPILSVQSFNARPLQEYLKEGRG